MKLKKKSKTVTKNICDVFTSFNSIVKGLI